MSERIWLSGSRGFVGSAVAHCLRKAGWDIRCISNSEVTESDMLFADFSDRDSIRRILNAHGAPDTFIHLGWGSVYQPHDASHLTSNLENGINLIDEMYAAGVSRILLIGSSSEYGDHVGALSEDLEPLGSVNNYVKGKQALARYGRTAADRLSKIFIHVRLFYTYGAGQKHNSLINQLYQAYLGRKSISLSPCEQYRDYIHVSEAAEGLRRICGVNRSAVINLGGGSVIQLRRFVEIFWKRLGADPAKLVFGAHEKPALEQSQPRAYADLTRLEQLTSWRPSLSIEDGIEETVAQLHADHGAARTRADAV